MNCIFNIFRVIGLLVLFQGSVSQVQAADRNGSGVVYHISDCGYPNVRMYAFGGDGPGSACGRWLAQKQLDYIWAQISGGWDHNFSLAEISIDFQRFCAVATKYGVQAALDALTEGEGGNADGVGDFLNEIFCQ